MAKYDVSKLAEVLRKARLAKGLSRYQASVKTGLSACSMKNYEEGINWPGVLNLVALMEVYDLKTEDIFKEIKPKRGWIY